ncbi:MAG TPA: NEW3 domain-containing protein [Planctomycetota bacterium]|nr:NEW3 domain-containing protein [Planctomycetota bacterium]HRR80585.1 NEW3 domain-containing protein [Planctomycetota bacterium]HRT94428.1 NEW3 domain-containing protein [Planctomycetota bacterium]
MRCALFLPAITLSLTVAFAQEPRMTLKTDRPGNLFAFGQKISVQVEAKDAEWHVTDLDGAEVAKGKGAIEIANLPHGYYELVAKTGEQSAKLPFGVVADHSASPPPSGRLNVDGATAWLERHGRHEAIAQMLRTVGIGWVRERFSWAGTEPEKGKVTWQQYDATADAFTKHGVRVYQIFHDSPAWSHAGKKNTRNPADLRDAYAFAKRLAEHYKGRVQAWEVWNEPDIFFWPDLSDTFAGLQKAAYLGFKAGDPTLPVLLGSFCRGHCAFDENLFDAGIRDYFDVFNWHIYAPPEQYPATLARYLELLKRHGCDERPVWLTEAGIRLTATEPDGEITAADERRQADFVPKSFAYSLAAGTDSHFFFVLPYYLEHGVQFGALRKDLSPRPGFIAIAAAVDILGEARFLGLRQEAGLTTLAFHNGRERVLVAWSNASREVELPVAAQKVVVANCVGKRNEREAAGGTLKLPLSPSPQYIIGVGDEALKGLGGTARPQGKLPANQPSPIVLRAQAQVPTLDKDSDSYVIGDEPFAYAVEACNFGEKAAAGRIALELPAGWQAEPAEAPVSLEPMGRLVSDFRITPGTVALGPQRIRVKPAFGDPRVAPAVSSFRFDLARVKPTKELGLGLDDPARWQKNISGNGTMEIGAVKDSGVRFEATFTAPGDRWCYPRSDFGRPMDFSAYQAISFEYRCHANDDATAVRLQLIEPNGACYLTATGWKARKDWTRATAAFADLAWGSYSPRDPNGALDLKAIRALMIGLNTPRDAAWLEIRNVRLVQLAQ